MSETVNAYGETVVIEKTPWYKKLATNPITKKVVKGLAIAGALFGAGRIGYKIGVSKNDTDEEEETEEEAE